jgi:hypothetical protein
VLLAFVCLLTILLVNARDAERQATTQLRNVLWLECREVAHKSGADEATVNSRCGPSADQWPIGRASRY